MENDPLQAGETAFSLPPPVEAIRVDKGVGLFPGLLLPAAPPMYRPFIIMEDNKKTKSKSDSLKESKLSSVVTTSHYTPGCGLGTSLTDFCIFIVSGTQWFFLTVL